MDMSITIKKGFFYFKMNVTVEIRLLAKFDYCTIWHGMAWHGRAGHAMPCHAMPCRAMDRAVANLETRHFGKATKVLCFRSPQKTYFFAVVCKLRNYEVNKEANNLLLSRFKITL